MKSLQKIYEDISILSFHNVVDDIVVDNDLLRYFECDFCPEKIKKYIVKCNKCLKVTVDGHNIRFNFYYYNVCPILLSKILLSVKQAVAVKKYFNINKSLEINLVLSPYKRFIPVKKCIAPEHINGGYTSTSEGKIFVIRSEEYSKVMIHEIIHHVSNINHYNFPMNNIIELKREFNISDETTLIPNEAIVELWATMLNCAFISFEFNIPYQKILDIEIQYSIMQSNKILKKQGNKKWEERTNAYCYIIFKTIFLYNLKKFTEGYTFPYDTQYITKFLIDHKKLPTVAKYAKMFSVIRGSKSLRMMMLSD